MTHHFFPPFLGSIHTFPKPTKFLTLLQLFTLVRGHSHRHRTAISTAMEGSPVDWNSSSSRSLRSSSRLHQQHSGLSGGGSGTSQTHQHQQQPPTHANHNHMSGVPQPPPPASTSRSAHKGTTITTAVTPEETLTTRRSKRISTMAHNPYHGSEYPSSSASGKSKSLLASRRDFHGNPEKE